MIIVRAPKSTRMWLAAGLLGLLPILGGCDDNKNDKPIPPPDAARQESERAAREKAFGPGGMPNPKPGANKAAEKAAEKSAEKAAEKSAPK